MSYRVVKTIWIPTLLVALLFNAPSAQAQDNQGFIYGRVVTESGTEYTGFLRWGNQEAFWDDLFHSAKEVLPYLEDLEEDDRRDLRRRGRKRFSFPKIWNMVIEDDGWPGTRMFIARFGDISRIEPRRRGQATVHMRNGKEYEVKGASDDVSSKIHVGDKSLGKIDLRWDRIESIEFMSAPKGADPGVWRLYGKVETHEGDFEGYIQWDKQECLNIDRLDGDTEDGDLSIEMGRIRSIERRGRRSSTVVLKDDRTLRLHGSNDVNHENRGIMIQDPDYGRVTVGWKSFKRLTFIDSPGSGQGYGDYPARGPLTGTVTDDKGKKYNGRIVFDLDESEGWEMLNGKIEDVEFDIPFWSVISLEPRGSDECRIVLKSGKKLTFEDGHDVTGRNAGILVFTDDDRDPVYLRWKDIERMEFDHRG